MPYEERDTEEERHVTVETGMGAKAAANPGLTIATGNWEAGSGFYPGLREA